MVSALKEKDVPKKNAMQRIPTVMGQEVTGDYVTLRLPSKILLKR